MESAACRCQGGSFNYPLENMGPHLSSGSTYPIRTPGFLDGALPFLTQKRGHSAMELLRLSPHKNYQASIKPEPITGGGDPRSMVPVRRAGAEVSESLCTSAAVLS